MEEAEHVAHTKCQIYDRGARRMIDTMMRRQEEEVTKQRRDFEPRVEELSRLYSAVAKRAKEIQHETSKTQIPTSTNEQLLQDLGDLERTLH